MPVLVTIFISPTLTYPNQGKNMTNDKRLKRFERNMSKINDQKLDYKTVDNEWIQIKTTRGEMLFNPYSNHFRLEGKLIYGNASNMINHLDINKMT